MKSRLLVLAVLLPHLGLAQQLSLAFALEAPLVGPAGDEQEAPAVAWTGSEFFVVWSDRRDGRSRDLWFRRFDGQGAALTALSVPLLRAPREQQRPVAATGNDSVLVAWLDDTTCASEVMAQRFSPTGQPAGARLVLSTGACTSERPSVAWDKVSATWLVAWGAHGTGRDVHGALIAADGSVSVSDFVIASGANSARTPWVSSPAGGAGGFLVTWADDRLSAGVPNVYAATVTSAGAVGAANQVGPGATSQSAPCVASHGSSSDLLITWVEGTSVLAQRTTNAGANLGGPFVVTSGALTDATCAMGPLGSVLVASTDTRAIGPGVFLRLVDVSLAVSGELEVAPRISYFGRDMPRVALAGAQALLVARGPWGYVNGNDIVGRLVSFGAGLEVDAGVFLVATGGTNLSKVNAAFDGANYLAVWRDDGQSYGGSDSFGQLLEPGTGRGRVDGGLRFSTHSGNLVSFPSVGGSDAGFFVSWGDDNSGGQLRGMRVSSQGALSPSQLISDTSSYVFTSTSRWLGDGWATASLKNGSVHLRRTSVAGTAALPETTLVPTGTTVEQLDSASLDEVLLNVFRASDAGFDVRGARFDADAGLLDPSGFAIAAKAGDEVDPAVGAGKTLFLVAWSQGGEVVASRVTKQGAVLDEPPLQVGVGPGIDLAPAVGWTGTAFLVAWQRDGDVVGARVSESGALLDASPIVLAATAELDRAPRVVGGPPGEALVTWEAFSEPWGNFRALGRFVGEGDAGSADAGAGDPDAGGAGDAGGADAGSSDAGVGDPGASAERDGGALGPAGTFGVGCACSQADGLCALGLLVLARRRAHRGAVASRK